MGGREEAPVPSLADKVTTQPSVVVEAAGGVLWRRDGAGHGVEVALVHRPKYDDWSLPKGKLLPGEHVIVGAVREVQEETGVTAAVGRPLGELRYLKDGQPTRVRYWSMRAVRGEFSPHEEVDQVRWLPPGEAARTLSPDRDRRILETYGQAPHDTWPLLLLRHASAGSRDQWRGEDRERPLDPLGHRQAQALVTLLDAFQPEQVVSADVLRCLDTVGPFAAERGLTVESEPLVSEVGYRAHPEAAEQRVAQIASAGRSVVVCSQRGPVPELVERLCRRLTGQPPPLDGAAAKAGLLVVHLARTSPVTVVAVERIDPPAV